MAPPTVRAASSITGGELDRPQRTKPPRRNVAQYPVRQHGPAAGEPRQHPAARTVCPRGHTGYERGQTIRARETGGGATRKGGSVGVTEQHPVSDHRWAVT
jgi:hypothetical protein